jgi:hypothetical protein
MKEKQCWRVRAGGARINREEVVAFFGVRDRDQQDQISNSWQQRYPMRQAVCLRRPAKARRLRRRSHRARRRGLYLAIHATQVSRRGGRRGRGGTHQVR